VARKRIELAPGSILPATRPLWGEALEKLDEAAIGISLMQQPGNSIIFSSGWKRFVDALEQSWVCFFDEGKRQFTDFQPWAGRVDAKRRKDPLLRYILEARHQSQHGGTAIEWTAPVLRIAPTFNGAVHRIRTFDDGTYEIEARPLQPWMPQATVDYSPGEPILRTIINSRYPDQQFPPPTEHQVGAEADTSPLAVAEIGHRFYAGVYAEALEKFGSRAKPPSV